MSKEFKFIPSSLNSVKPKYLKADNTPQTGDVAVDNGEGGFHWVAPGTEEFVDIKDLKVSANDTSPNYLQNKVTGETDNITLTVVNDGGDENLHINVGSNIFKIDTNDAEDITETANKVFVTPEEKTAITHSNRANLDAIDQDLSTTDNVQFNAIKFDTTPTAIPTDIGTMYWDETSGGVSVKLNDEVSLQLGQEMILKATNNSGVDIPNGGVVYISGAFGDNPTIAMGSNSDVTQSDRTIGVATEDILDGETGFVTAFGLVRDVDTSDFLSGDIVYLGTTAGSLTNVKPLFPYADVNVGTILHVGETDGMILVNPRPSTVRKQDRVQTLNRVAGADLDSGTITEATNTTIVDTTKTWTVNAYANKVVKVNIDADNWFYAIIASNTTNQLTLDDPTLVVASGTYRILDTVLANVNTIIAGDIRTNSFAVILPDIIPEEERQIVHVYVEMATEGTGHSIPIIARGAERIRGFKYVALESRFEGTRLYEHTWGAHHWDILQLDNIYRHYTTRRTVAEALPVGAYDLTGTVGNFVVENAKRFRPINKAGKTWVRYTSVQDQLFTVNGNFNLTKTGGGVSNVYLAVRVYDYSENTTVDYTSIIGKAKFAVADSQQITFTVPITLSQNDEVAIIGYTDVATVTVDIGSNVIVREM